MKKPQLLLTLLVLASLTACQEKKVDLFAGNDSTNLFKEDIKFPEDKKPTGDVQPVVTEPTKPGAPIVQYERNAKSTSRTVSVAELQKGNYYESVVSEVEGFRSNLYNDNIGYALGNGWNVSLQTSQTNKRVASAIGLPSEQVAALASLSGVMLPTSLPKVSVTPEQATKAAQEMRSQYEEPIKGIVSQEVFNKLKPNEQATLVYHTYKVGPGGAAKYKNLIANLKSYTSSPTPELAKKVAEGFTYSYKMNGKVYQDQRSQLYMSALFLDPKAYGYLIGADKAPSNFQEIAKLSNQKIDTNKPVDAQIKDDFGQAKEKIIESGQLPVIEVQAPKDKEEKPCAYVNGMCLKW